MLAQYRKLARIEPFDASKDLPSDSKVLEHFEFDQSEVLEQLKCLTSAVNNLQQLPPIVSSVSSEHSESVFASHDAANKLNLCASEDVTNKLVEDVQTIRSQLQQLAEANEAVAFLKSKIENFEAKIENLESNLEEKNRLIEVLTENHKRLTVQLNDEKQKVLDLDRKLESEKRAATQVGKDITKYVERMNEMEAKVSAADPKILDLEKRLAEKSQTSQTLAKENADLKQKLETATERQKNSDLETSSKSNKTVSAYLERINDLELKVRADSKEKESLKTTIEILKDQLTESRQLSCPDLNESSFSNGTSFCRSCIDGDRLEDAARKVQELAVDIQHRTEVDIDRLTSQTATLTAQNATFLKENRSLEAMLRQEQNLRHTLETKVTVCQNEIRLVLHLK